MNKETQKTERSFEKEKQKQYAKSSPTKIIAGVNDADWGPDDPKKEEIWTSYNTGW